MSMGYVYILTNPSFQEDWVKIGKTRRPVNVRSAELDNTAVPLPFKVYATIKTEQYEKVERRTYMRSALPSDGRKESENE